MVSGCDPSDKDEVIAHGARNTNTNPDVAAEAILQGQARTDVSFLQSLRQGVSDGHSGTCGYSGNGSPNATEVTNLANLLGTSGSISNTGELDINLDTAYAQALLNSGNFELGLVLVADNPNLQTGFASEEMAWASSGWFSPTLMVSYATPEPATLALLCLGGLAMGIRRRRYRDTL